MEDDVLCCCIAVISLCFLYMFIQIILFLSLHISLMKPKCMEQNDCDEIMTPQTDTIQKITQLYI